MSALPGHTSHGTERKIVSWNLLRLVGATPRDVAQLVAEERPDLLLMQEATADFDALPRLIGGHYARSPLPGRIHGVACWSPAPFRRHPVACTLPSGPLVRRVAQMIECSTFGFTVANVHLSHGQIMNRRQLRRLGEILPAHAAVLGDFNLVGPTLMPHFHDVGPRAPTHRMVDMLPIRIDRCMVRGLTCREARVLENYASDHRPITVRLERSSSHR
ncbi:endonuclease/exonuclease/phosphatase family protein [Nguyenibacter vanlangensis]|uniref:Endonuclease/exonuclease/phosphatase family protein n=1 Tax=Nguyenibacter vanlangensis TaxID=1216886 RepID=A0ABZ3D710_9PROT